MAYHTNFPERSRIYSSLTSMVTDGFATLDQAYRMVGSIFSQNPRPPQVVVGREEGTQKMKITVTPSATHIFANHDYTLNIDGQNATHTSVASPTAATIATGLKTAIDALTLNVAVTDNSGSIDIEASTIADAFSIYSAIWQELELLDVTPNGVAPGIVEDIQAVQAENDDWYGLNTTVQSKEVIAAAAVYIETINKLYIAATLDADVVNKTAGNIGETLNTAGYARTGLIFHHKANLQYAGAAWQGKCLPSTPGNITWKFHSLAGVDYQDLNDTQKSNLQSYKVNYYIRDAGLSYTTEGYTSSGEFIDVTRISDWTVARIQESVFGTFKQASDTGTKIPYTDKGAGTIKNDVSGVLNQGATNEAYVRESIEVTVPKVADVSVANRANRLLPDVEFTATFQGAIHATQISGVVSV
jgi:hypothetical protein